MDENMDKIAYFNGYRLIATDSITKEVPQRCHRKRRIHKKWLKRYGYKTVPDDGKIIVIGDKIMGTKKTIEKIIQIAEQVDMTYKQQKRPVVKIKKKKKENENGKEQ